MRSYGCNAETAFNKHRRVIRELWFPPSDLDTILDVGDPSIPPSYTTPTSISKPRSVSEPLGVWVGSHGFKMNSLFQNEKNHNLFSRSFFVQMYIPEVISNIYPEECLEHEHNLPILYNYSICTQRPNLKYARIRLRKDTPHETRPEIISSISSRTHRVIPKVGPKIGAKISGSQASVVQLEHPRLTASGP